MNIPKVDIIMVSWKRPEMTELVIKTIYKNTTTPHRLILIDNGSGEGTQETLKQLKERGMIDELILFKNNIGLEPAKNVGMMYVKSDLFISTDNDCLPEKPDLFGDWLSRLINLIKKNKDYASIACRPQVLVGTGNIFNEHENDDVIEFSHPGGCLRIMRTDLVKEVGGWRDNVSGRGQEEMYIAGKFRELGFKSGFAVKIKCYHLFGKDSNWGYGDLKPEYHGHKPVWHPSIVVGDNGKELKEYI